MFWGNIHENCLKIINHVGIDPGYFTVAFCSLMNAQRKRRANHRWTETVKKRRKVLRAQNKQKRDMNKKKEGTPYKKGGFWKTCI